MKHFKTQLAVVALAASAFAAQAQRSELELQVNAATAAAPVSQSLNGVVVTGHGNALLRSDQRLALLKASLPLGASNTAVQPTDLQRVVALFPQQPDAATGEAKRMMERGQTPPRGPDADGSVAVGTW